MTQYWVSSDGLHRAAGSLPPHTNALAPGVVWQEVAQADWEAGADAFDQAAAQAAADGMQELLIQAAVLRIGRSPMRSGATKLNGAVVTPGTQQAIFLDVPPGVDTTGWSVTFSSTPATAVPNRVETDAPFDAFGTLPDGTASRSHFNAGQSPVTVQAVLARPGKPPVTFTGKFYVEA